MQKWLGFHHLIILLLSEFSPNLVIKETGGILTGSFSLLFWFCNTRLGSKDLQLQGRTASGSPEEKKLEVSDCTADSDEVEKEISSLCWASNDGSILAVGYVDGDIMFWNLSAATPKKNQQAEKSPNNVVKLQLSSGEKRLPVIVLHRSANQSRSDHGCKLFVYGSDKIGSEVVLTILSLEWSSGIENLKCVNRVDLVLNGSFVDMILLPTVGEMKSGGNLLFVLSNPGQLQVYDDVCLASFMSQQEKKPCVSSGLYFMPIPTVAPCMTVSKLGLVDRDGEFSKALSKIVSTAKLKAPHTPTTASRKWPLTGGIPSLLSEAADYQVERVYMAGYQDGSVRIWDATYPALSLIFVLGTEISSSSNVRQIDEQVPGIDIAGTNASALEICSFTHSVAIGNECGMVRLYKLTGTSDGMSLNIVKETEKLPACRYLLPNADVLYRPWNYGSASVEAKSDISAQVAYFGERSKSSLVLLWFEDALHLCSLNSVIQGTTDSIRAVNLSKQCCWTSAFKIDDKECGLVLLYRTGVLEISSLTTLEVMRESSLMTILRWNFKMNMEKMICSSNRGQIILIHGCEFAAISLLALENDFRSLFLSLCMCVHDSGFFACVHDTVLAAAFDATVIGLSPSRNKSQDTAPGILGGIIKGLKVEKRTERERLFESACTDTKPRLRTPEEIRAKYKGAEDAAAAAAPARDRFVKRQEKLERINERTQELQSEAENFASMANELAKRMEKRKWWNV
ncbi:hypothetical protein CRYUN_Cryun05aG0147900 [Craigia yunnanensis]